MTFMKWQKYCGLHNYIMSRFTRSFLLSKKVPDDEGDETKRACLKELGTNKVRVLGFTPLQGFTPFQIGEWEWSTPFLE